MLRARIRDEADGTANVIVGLNRSEMASVALNHNAMSIPLHDMGIDLNLVIIVRATDEELVDLVKQINPDEDSTLVIDKRVDDAKVAAHLVDRVARDPLLRAAVNVSLRAETESAGNAEEGGNRAARRNARRDPGNKAYRKGR